jgi:hypothetical protein
MDEPDPLLELVQAWQASELEGDEVIYSKGPVGMWLRPQHVLLLEAAVRHARDRGARVGLEWGPARRVLDTRVRYDLTFHGLSSQVIDLLRVVVTVT